MSQEMLKEDSLELIWWHKHESHDLYCGSCETNNTSSEILNVHSLSTPRSYCSQVWMQGGVISAVLKQPEHIIISSLTSFVTRKTSLQPPPNPRKLPSTSEDLLKRNRVIKETCSWSKAFLTIQAARWEFLQLEICKSQVLFFID